MKGIQLRTLPKVAGAAVGVISIASVSAYIYSFGETINKLPIKSIQDGILFYRIYT